MKKEENIIESNKLFAVFMGATPCKDWQGFDGFEHLDWYHTQWSNRYQETLELYSYRYSELLYNSSYDWLMLVVEKAQEVLCSLKDIDDEIAIEFYRGDDKPLTFVSIKDLDIETSDVNPMVAIYDAMVKFVKWYNENIK